MRKHQFFSLADILEQVKLEQCNYNNDSNLIGVLANYKKVY